MTALRPLVLNFLAVGAVALVAAGHLSGLLAAGDAFYGAFLAMVVLTGYHLARMSGTPFWPAVRRLLTIPRGTRGKVAYAAYFAAAIPAVFIVFDAVTV